MNDLEGLIELLGDGLMLELRGYWDDHEIVKDLPVQGAKKCRISCHRPLSNLHFRIRWRGRTLYEEALGLNMAAGDEVVFDTPKVAAIIYKLIDEGAFVAAVD